MLATTGDPVIHIGLLALTLSVYWTEQSCLGVDHGVLVRLMVVTHTVNALRLVVTSVMIWLVPLYADLTLKLYFIEKIFDFVGLVFYFLAIIYIQDVYFFNQHLLGQCPAFEAVMNVLQIEIVIFYGHFASNFVFILFSEFLMKKSGIAYLEKSENKSDFLLKYRTMNGLH